ncbi:hypothetical protein JTB14_035110 [Gonioctena quinquepunctata]|nr:hypothetical protein JTB14_035110 [Gonioctena quinquepunctata]
MAFRLSEICKCADFFFELDNRPQIRENVTKFLIHQRIPARMRGYSPGSGQKDDPEPRRKRCSRIKKNILDGAQRGLHEGDAGNFFGAPLDKLTPKNVTLVTGFWLSVPKMLHELCKSVLANVEKRGVFRKQGCNTGQARKLSKTVYYLQ